MSSRSRHRGPSRRHEPTVERMESRDLLSVAATRHPDAPRPPRAGRQALHAVAAVPAATPTAHERAREAFDARFQGSYTTGPGRFAGDALLTFFKAGGTSNQFLHGDVLIQITTPKDPSLPVTGTAELFAKNISTTGTALVLDLTGTVPADPLRPPTQLNWTVNSASGGAYTNATGQGTLKLIYFPGGRRPDRAFQAGSAGAVFQGTVNSTGAGNILAFGG